jgi:hypothetical protein
MGTTLIVLPLSATRAIVIESRRPIGWDKQLVESGALVYLVDTAVNTTKGPIQILADIFGEGFSAAPLSAGEYVDAAALGEIVAANAGRRGFTYTHKKTPEALYWVQCANDWGFTVNLSADDAGEADALAAVSNAPLTCIVPMDTPEKSYTPEGQTIIVCPAQTRDDITCATCGLCARADRRVIIGFRAHGSRARVTDALARRIIPIVKG